MEKRKEGVSLSSGSEVVGDFESTERRLRPSTSSVGEALQNPRERTDPLPQRGKRDRAFASLRTASQPCARSKRIYTTATRSPYSHASAMTTDNTEPSAPPPKKRSFFKKAAWQTAVKPEGDIFSHSNEYKDIVAEEAKRRKEEKEKSEAGRKREEEEERERKRRRFSDEAAEIRVSGSGSKVSPRTGRTGRKGYVNVMV